MSLYKPLIILAQVVIVSGNITPIRDTFNSRFKESIKWLIKVDLFYRVSLTQQQNLVKYNGKLLEPYTILFSFLYIVAVYVTEPYSKNYGGSYYWARCVENASNNSRQVITTGGVVAQQINSNYILRITIRKELSRQGLRVLKYITVLL